MKKAEEWSEIYIASPVLQLNEVIEMVQNEAWNEATILANESATAYIAQESVNGSKIAKVNQESILKNLKK